MEDMKMAVTELGYIGVGAKDLDAWKHYATEILGMELRPGEDDRRCYLRMDYWHHR
jgi:2,3-dihydroxyethylbenzene 1,2-dioxygenase